MRTSILAAILFTFLASVVRSSPVTRDNDGSRPITWISPEGIQRCWQVDNGNIRANEILVVAACDNNSDAQRFIYNTGATTIQVAGTNLCVEFGPGLGVNGRPLRVQNCRRNGAPGQRLFVTDDDHISLQNGPGQCADVTDGGESAQLQSWRCFAENTNQIFFGEPPVPPQPSPSEGVTLSPFLDGSLCFIKLFGFSELQGPYAIRPCDVEGTPPEKRFFFEIGQVGIRQRPDGSDIDWTLEADILEVGGNPVIGDPGEYGDTQGDPFSRFVPEAGEGEFSGSVRLRNTFADLCIEAESPFSREEFNYVFLNTCNESEPLQYFTFAAFPV